VGCEEWKDEPDDEQQNCEYGEYGVFVKDD